MHGATCTPAGNSRPSTRSGAASLRGATVSTGRMPMRVANAWAIPEKAMIDRVSAIYATPVLSAE